jgi:iron complex outermembrane recepter protein
MRKVQSLRFWAVWLLFLCLFSSGNFVFAQRSYKLYGTVTDSYSHPLTGAVILLHEKGVRTSTDQKGAFVFGHLPKGRYTVSITFLGYKTWVDTFFLNSDTLAKFSMVMENQQLNEVILTENISKTRKAESSMAVDVVDDRFLRSNLAGSLMQTLNRLPGVSSMDIGAGQSKPVIRGLGFNRIAVVENGVKHEAQEWGADHGLEIDQLSVEQVEVIKGPASLMYGASAIGGVIDLKQLQVPVRQTQGGGLFFNVQTNNNLYGVSAKYFKRCNHFYFKTHFTYTDYSDYRVPTDSISYMSYYFRLKNNRLRNTAGRDRNGGFAFGYLGKNLSTHINITDNYSKSGFFANAHGLEIRTSTINYDKSDRDIDLPYQQVNHLKILSNTIWIISDLKLKMDLGFQNNNRQEFSEAIAHGYMPVPQDSLERKYKKNTYTANLMLELPVHSSHRLTTGINMDLQKNKIGGWGFILPAFTSFNGGLFVYDYFRLSEKWKVNAGIRYDLGKIHTTAYYDWYLTPQDDGTNSYVQRANELERTSGSLCWGGGVIRTGKTLTLKVNIGKSFRMPTAKELASNGINYHLYRFEKGDATLQAEESYQMDFGVLLEKGKLRVEWTPFLNYFPNYIYLNPTSEYYEAQQIYYYSQSRVFRSGGEFTVNYELSKTIALSADAEYIYSVQLSGTKKGYTLPFSPPLTSNIGLTYSPESGKILKGPSVGIEMRVVADQNNIVPPEKKTAGYGLFNIKVRSDVQIGSQRLEWDVQLNNVFNTRYYDHTSFYRLIEVPGQGRNLVITLQVPFGKM